MKKFLLFATAAFAFSSMPVFAEDAPVVKGSLPEASGHEHGKEGRPGHWRMFEENDTDNDGVVSKTEFLAGSEKKFTEMDANGDSKLTKDEIEARREEWRKKMKEMRDKKRAEKAASQSAPAEPAAPADKQAQ